MWLLGMTSTEVLLPSSDDEDNLNMAAVSPVSFCHFDFSETPVKGASNLSATVESFARDAVGGSLWYADAVQLSHGNCRPRRSISFCQAADMNVQMGCFPTVSSTPQQQTQQQQPQHQSAFTSLCGEEAVDSQSSSIIPLVGPVTAVSAVSSLCDVKPSSVVAETHGGGDNVARKDEDIDCEISTQSNSDDDEKDEWSFTLYDFDGQGKITKEDLATLMKSFYEVVGSSLSIRNAEHCFCGGVGSVGCVSGKCGASGGGGQRKLKLRLSVMPKSITRLADTKDCTDRRGSSGTTSCSENAAATNSNRNRSYHNNAKSYRKILAPDSLQNDLNQVKSIQNVDRRHKDLQRLKSHRQSRTFEYTVGEKCSTTAPSFSTPTELTWQSCSIKKQDNNLSASDTKAKESPRAERRIRHRARRDMAKQMVAEWLYKEPVWPPDESDLPLIDAAVKQNELTAAGKLLRHFPGHHTGAVVHEHRHVHEHHHHYHYHHYQDS